MPRSVNHVASRARRKNLMKLAKGYFGRRKNVSFSMRCTNNYFLAIKFYY